MSKIKDVKELEIRAVNGDAESQYELGLLLISDKEFNEGIKWLTKAGSQGHRQAQVLVRKTIKVTGYSYKKDNIDDKYSNLSLIFIVTLLIILAFFI